MLEKLKKKFKKSVSVPDDWEKLRDIVDRIFENTKEERDKMSQYLDRYNGKIWDEEKLEEYDSRAILNFFFSTIQQIAPMLTDNRPRWAVVATQPHKQKIAALYSQALQYFWETRDMNHKLLLAVMDALIMRLGLFKITFDPNDGFGGNVNVDVVDPREFFIAPGYTDPWDAPFCGMRSRKPLSWVKRRFEGVDEIKPETGLSGEEEDGISTVKFGDTPDFMLDCKFVTVTEVWMRDDQAMEDFDEELPDGNKKKSKKQKYPYGKFVYFTSNDFLAEEPCPYMFNRAPYVPLYDYVRPHDFIGTGELDNTHDLILQLNKIFQAMNHHFDRYHNPNVMIDAAAGVDPDTVKNTYHKGGQMYTFDSQVNQNQEPIKTVKEPVMNPIAMQVFNMGPRLLEEITGVTEMAKGVLTTKQEKSASESSILIESSYTRVRQRVRNLEWTIKRVCYLVIRMMQQFYTEPKTFWNKQDDEIEYGEISNSRARAEEIVRSPETAKKAENGGKLDPEEQQEQEDYKKLIEEFESEVDPVYFDFDIVIDTNSTLPMDKQSLANLGMKLFERKAIDADALLEVLQWPKGDEIIKRMERRIEERDKAKAPPQGPRGLSGPPPPPQQANPGSQGDMQEFMSALTQGG